MENTHKNPYNVKFNETEKVEHTRNVVSETNGYVLLFGIRWRLTNVGLSIDCNDWLNTTDNFCDIPTKKIITRNDATHINTIISNKRKRPLCILRLRVCLSDNPYTAKEKQYRKHILFEIILETMIICIGKRKKKEVTYNCNPLNLCNNNLHKQICWSCSTTTHYCVCTGNRLRVLNP